MRLGPSLLQRAGESRQAHRLAVAHKLAAPPTPQPQRGLSLHIDQVQLRGLANVHARSLDARRLAAELERALAPAAKTMVQTSGLRLDHVVSGRPISRDAREGAIAHRLAADIRGALAREATASSRGTGKVRL